MMGALHVFLDHFDAYINTRTVKFNYYGDLFTIIIIFLQLLESYLVYMCKLYTNLMGTLVRTPLATRIWAIVFGSFECPGEGLSVGCTSIRGLGLCL